MEHPGRLSPLSRIIFPLFIAVFATIPVLVSGQARAAALSAEEWEITADKVTRFEDPLSIIAEGNVVLEKIRKTTRIKKKKTSTSGWNEILEESEKIPAAAGAEETVTESRTMTTIMADWIAYDMDLATVKARGNLRIKIGPDELTADEGKIDLQRETGTFKNAVIIRQYKQMHLEGRVIEKIGDLTYHIEDGWLITCKLKDNETPPWSFNSVDTKITDGGYAFLKHATFRIKNVPVLYTPLMILPAKRSRQTGFLLPELSLSDRDGFGVNLPFFVNLSPSADLTFYPAYHANRGFMPGVEFRYMLNERDKGNFMATYLNDDLSDPSEVEYYADGKYTHTNRDRYWIRGKADQEFGTGWISRLDIDIVSDRDYLTEFSSGITGFTTGNKRFLRIFGRSLQNSKEDQRLNSFNILKSWQGISLQGGLLAVNDVRAEKRFLVPDPGSTDPDHPGYSENPSPLWKMPSLSFTGLMPIADTGMDFSWNADYVNYWREDGIGGHRLDIHPRVSTSIPVGPYLEATAGGGIRATSYLVREYGAASWDGNDTENRLLFDFNTELGTTLMRDFSVNIAEGTGITHTLRPFIAYDFIPDVDQDDLPSFDSVDRIGERNAITYGVNNFFRLTGINKNKFRERDYLTLKIQQSYDLRSEKSDEPFLPINFRLWYSPLTNLRFVYKTDLDVYDDGFISHSVEADYRNSRGDFLSLDYRNDDAGNLQSIKAKARVQLLPTVSAGYSIERSLEHDKTIEEYISLIYQPSCWSAELSSHYTPGNRNVMLIFRLANIGDPLNIHLPGF